MHRCPASSQACCAVSHTLILSDRRAAIAGSSCHPVIQLFVSYDTKRKQANQTGLRLSIAEIALSELCCLLCCDLVVLNWIA